MALDVQDLRVRDDMRFTRTGEAIDEKIATFYLGHHGPFTERFRAEEWSDTAFNARVQKLRAELQRIGAS